MDESECLLLPLCASKKPKKNPSIQPSRQTSDLHSDWDYLRDINIPSSAFGLKHLFFFTQDDFEKSIFFLTEIL